MIEAQTATVTPLPLKDVTPPDTATRSAAMHNEQAIIKVLTGCDECSPDLVDQVTDKIDPVAFIDPLHTSIMTAIRQLASDGKLHDTGAVLHEMNKEAMPSNLPDCLNNIRNAQGVARNLSAYVHRAIEYSMSLNGGEQKKKWEKPKSQKKRVQGLIKNMGPRMTEYNDTLKRSVPGAAPESLLAITVSAFGVMLGNLVKGGPWETRTGSSIFILGRPGTEKSRGIVKSNGLMFSLGEGQKIMSGHSTQPQNILQAMGDGVDEDGKPIPGELGNRVIVQVLDEAAEWMRNALTSQDSGLLTLLELMAQPDWHAGLVYSKNAGNKSIPPITLPCLSLLGASTIEDFWDAADTTGTSNGQNSRLFVIQSDAEPPQEMPLPSAGAKLPESIKKWLESVYGWQHAQGIYSDVFQDPAQHTCKPVQIDFTDEGMTEKRRFFKETQVVRNQSNTLAKLLARDDMKLDAFALIRACDSDNQYRVRPSKPPEGYQPQPGDNPWQGTFIGKEDVLWAEELVKLGRATMVANFSKVADTHFSKQWEKALQFLRDAGKATRGQLITKMRITATDADKLLDAMSEGGVIHVTSTPREGGGRPHVNITPAAVD